jgi:hypothetical protein
MKTLLLIFALASASFSAVANDGTLSTAGAQADTMKLQVDNRDAFYKQTVKADSLSVDLIFNRTIQFMAAKNFTQTYGYEEEGKLIFTTSQDLNINPVYVGDDNDIIDPYTAQFAVILDIKPGVYRYIITNVVFFHPAGSFSKRETLLDIYSKATNTESKRVARNAQKLISSFEKYLHTLVDDLYQGIEQKSVMYSSKF